MRPPAIEQFLARAEDAWKRDGGRMTPVRRVIAQVIAEKRGVFRAEDLLPLVRERDRGVSLASIYRALGDLARLGLLYTRHNAGKGLAYSWEEAEGEAGLPAAATVVCRDCGLLHPMQNPCLVLREVAPVKSAGFRAKKLELRIEAECETLHSQGRCPRAEAREAGR